MKHELKTLPYYFKASWCGWKTFEIRKNDRNFQPMDEVVLQEFDPSMPGACGDYEMYTGREIEGYITYLSDHEQKDGYVVFSIEQTRRTEG